MWRLLAVIKKEFKEVIRDKGFMLTIILEPLILMLVFGYTFQANIKNLQTVVVAEEKGIYAQKIIQAVDESEYFRIAEITDDLGDARRQLKYGLARAVFYIPAEFDQNINKAKKAKITLFLDSSDYTIYNLLKGASGEVVRDSFRNIVNLVVRDLEAEKNNNKDRVEEIENLIKGAKERSQKTLSEVGDLNRKIKEAYGFLGDARGEVENNEDIVKDLQKKTDKIVKDIDKQIDKADDLEDALIQLGQVEPNVKSAVSSLAEEVDSLKGKMKKAVKEIEDLDIDSEIDAQKSYRHLDELERNLNDNELMAKDVDLIINDLEQDYNEAKEKVEKIDLQFKTLKKEFISEPLGLNYQYAFGEISYFQYLAPAIITLILFFIGVVLTVVNIVEERNNKTLFRLATTPLKKTELFGGKFLVFLLVGILEIVYVLVISILFFDVKVVGALWQVFFVLILLMGASVGLGLLISTLVRTMRQVSMYLPLIIIPSVLISQTFSPIEVMPKFMQWLAYLSPMLYSNVVLRDIMIKGTDISTNWVFVLVLFIYAVASLGFGILLMKKRID